MRPLEELVEEFHARRGGAAADAAALGCPMAPPSRSPLIPVVRAQQRWPQTSLHPRVESAGFAQEDVHVVPAAPVWLDAETKAATQGSSRLRSLTELAREFDRRQHGVPEVAQPEVEQESSREERLLRVLMEDGGEVGGPRCNVQPPGSPAAPKRWRFRTVGDESRGGVDSCVGLGAQPARLAPRLEESGKHMQPAQALASTRASTRVGSPASGAGSDCGRGGADAGSRPDAGVECGPGSFQFQ